MLIYNSMVSCFNLSENLYQQKIASKRERAIELRLSARFPLDTLSRESINKVLNNLQLRGAKKGWNFFLGINFRDFSTFPLCHVECCCSSEFSRRSYAIVASSAFSVNRAIRNSPPRGFGEKFLILYSLGMSDRTNGNRSL